MPEHLIILIYKLCEYIGMALLYINQSINNNNNIVILIKNNSNGGMVPGASINQYY